MSIKFILQGYRPKIGFLKLFLTVSVFRQKFCIGCTLLSVISAVLWQKVPRSAAFNSMRKKISRPGDPAHPKLKIILTFPSVSLLEAIPNNIKEHEDDSIFDKEKDSHFQFISDFFLAAACNFIVLHHALSEIHFKLVWQGVLEQKVGCQPNEWRKLNHRLSEWSLG